MYRPTILVIDNTDVTVKQVIPVGIDDPKWRTYLVTKQAKPGNQTGLKILVVL